MGGAHGRLAWGFLCTGAGAPGTRAFLSAMAAAPLHLRRAVREPDGARGGKSESSLMGAMASCSSSSTRCTGERSLGGEYEEGEGREGVGRGGRVGHVGIVAPPGARTGLLG
jgi:hypothetical protein